MNYNLCCVYTINPGQDKHQFKKKTGYKSIKFRKPASSRET